MLVCTFQIKWKTHPLLLLFLLKPVDRCLPVSGWNTPVSSPCSSQQPGVPTLFVSRPVGSRSRSPSPRMTKRKALRPTRPNLATSCVYSLTPLNCGNSHCGPHVAREYYGGSWLLCALDVTRDVRASERVPTKEKGRECVDEKGTGRGPFQRMRS